MHLPETDSIVHIRKIVQKENTSVIGRLTTFLLLFMSLMSITEQDLTLTASVEAVDESDDQEQR